MRTVPVLAHPSCPVGRPGAIVAHGAGDPGPRYAHLRQDHPVYRDEALGVWVVSRYADVDSVLRDGTGMFSTALGYLPLQTLSAPALTALARVGSVPVLSSLDPPGHARFRRAMNALWPTTARRISAHHEGIRSRTRAVAAVFAGRPGNTGDLVADYTRPLVAAVLGDIMGVPEAVRPGIADRAAALSALVWGRLDPAGQLAAAEALEELWQCCTGLVEQRRDQPADDAITGWLDYRDVDGTAFTPVEVASTLLEILITNAEITPRLIANALYRLLDSGTFQGVGCDADRVASAVEETLRHDPPLIGWLRCTTRDTELSGVPVPAGSRLLLLLGSAALDEAHGVVNSHVFDPMRVAQPANPVFGAGIHYCPGASYARLVARLAITELAGVCPDLALTEPTAAGPDNWPGNAALRSPAHLTVRW